MYPARLLLNFIFQRQSLPSCPVEAVYRTRQFRSALRSFQISRRSDISNPASSRGLASIQSFNFVLDIESLLEPQAPHSESPESKRGDLSNAPFSARATTRTVHTSQALSVPDSVLPDILGLNRHTEPVSLPSLRLLRSSGTGHAQNTNHILHSTLERRSSQVLLPTESPARKRSKWTLEEDRLMIELRGQGNKWLDIAGRLPGRSSVSCRLRYQNYLEKRVIWDKEKKNKLARLYARYVQPEMSRWPASIRI
jgi:hypothetical protein